MARRDFPLAYDPEVGRTRYYLDAVAANDDCDALIPDEHTIQLDFDSGHDEEMFRFCLAVIRRHTPIEVVEEYTSRGGGWHVILRIDVEISDLERVALQAILGSDPKREVLAWLRIREGIPYPSSLFKPRQRTYGGETNRTDDESDELPF